MLHDEMVCRHVDERRSNDEKIAEKISEIAVEGSGRGRCRPKKSWVNVVRDDMRDIVKLARK